MRVSGFTFIKDAIIYDYPIVEAIQSILPLCDEVVVAVGKSSDETLGLIQSIDDPKIRILETVWDESLREGGRVLAMETDKALHAIAKNADWAIYIQGDEVIHEKDLSAMQSAMLQYQSKREVDGFLFHYHHFYASYDYLASTSNFYRHEIRILRPGIRAYSYRDAQGFRKGNNQKLQVIQIPATVYHYGWVKPPKAMQAKQLNFNRYWHDDQWVNEHVGNASEYDYSQIRCLKRFEGSHPKVIQARIQRMNWKFEYDLSFNRQSLKDRCKYWLYRCFGWDLNYRNYKLLKP